MAAINWTGKSGDWSNASNWGGTLPTADDTVTIDVPSITVTVSATGEICYSLSTSQSTLDIVNGSLFTVDGANFGGEYLQSGGLYMVAGAGATFNDVIDTTGGTMQALAGATFAINDGGSLAGTFSGNGTLDFAGGTTYLNTGFASSISSIVVNAKLGFNTNFATSGDVADLGNGNMDLFGHTLTVSGNFLVDGVLGNGKVIDAGTMTVGAPQFATTLDNGLTVTVNGKLLQSGNVSFGTSDAGAKISVSRHGQYVINGNWQLGDPSSVGSITNAGLFIKSGGGKIAEIYTGFSNTGTIETETGTLLLNGLVNSINGSVTGAGTLGIAGGITTFGKKLTLGMAGLEQQSGVLVLNKAIGFAGQWDQSGGVLNFNSAAATLSLTGAANFDGGTITGYGGGIKLAGQTEMNNVLIGGPETLTVTGTLDQTGGITLGDSSNPVATLTAGATWSIENSSRISGDFGLIENAGTFIDTNGTGMAIVDPEFVSTGTVTVNNASLQFRGQTSLAGTVNGNGLLDLDGTTTLQNGLAISVAELDVNSTALLGGNLTYSKAYSQTSNATLDLAGHALTLSGTASFDGGTITDGGSVSATGGSTTIAGLTVQAGSLLSVTGTAEQTGTLSLGGGALTIGKGGLYTLADDVNINGNGTLTIAGELVADGTGVGTIAAATNLGGILQINDNVLQLGGGGNLAGTIAGTGTLALAGGTYVDAGGLAASSAAIDVTSNATLSLTANQAYAGYFIGAGTLALGGNDTLSLTGTTLLNGNATISGSGTVLASGDTTLSGVTIINGATLDIAGTAEQGPTSLEIAAAATLAIAGSGIYTLDAGQSIFGSGVLNVAGTLNAPGDGNSTINPNIVDAGKITSNLGTLDIVGSVTGKGSFVIGNAGTLQFSSGSTITASNTVSFASVGAALVLMDDNPPSFGAVLANFGAGNTIELADFSAATSTGALIDNNTEYQITDSNNGASITLTFSAAQGAGSLFIGTGSGGHVLVEHH